MTKLNNSLIIGILCAVWTLFNMKFNCPDLLTSPQTKIQQQKKDYNILKFQQPLFIDISFLLNPHQSALVKSATWNVELS